MVMMTLWEHDDKTRLVHNLLALNLAAFQREPANLGAEFDGGGASLL